tara:strand:- start:3474 stop:3635 length:162 start_codon:yes stop_codon:yes gene_type:complete
MGEFDEIVALGAIAADEVYGVLVPVLVLPEGGFDRLPTGQRVRIGIDGTVYSN